MSRNGIVKIRDGNLAGVPYLDPFEFLVKAAAIGTFEVGKLDQLSGTCESNCGGGKGVRTTNFRKTPTIAWCPISTIWGPS
jgi:hypothetical protein